jgi:hypothetical protein
MADISNHALAMELRRAEIQFDVGRRDDIP